VVGYVSIIHPAAASFAVGAAHNPAFAAAAWDATKRLAYRQVSSALPFVPVSVESFGCLGALALTQLGDLADQAVQAGAPCLSQAAFISGALRVALCWGNASLCRSGANVATLAAGRTPMRGLARLLAEVVEVFFAPRVWVLGLVQLRLALRSLALSRVCAITPSSVSGWRFSSLPLSVQNIM
jgi:hypothetical protein